MPVRSVLVPAYGLQNQPVDHMTGSHVDGLTDSISIGLADASLMAGGKARLGGDVRPAGSLIDTSGGLCKRLLPAQISRGAVGIRKSGLGRHPGSAGQ